MRVFSWRPLQTPRVSTLSSVATLPRFAGRQFGGPSPPDAVVLDPGRAAARVAPRKARGRACVERPFRAWGDYLQSAKVLRGKVEC